MKYFLFILLFFTELLYSNTLVVGDREEYPLLSYYEYSNSVDSNFTLEKIENSHWVKDIKDLKTATHKPYLIHFSVENRSSNKKEYLLFSQRGYLFSFEYYLVKDKKVVLSDASDFHRSSKSLKYRTLHIVLPLSIEPHECVDVYFRVENCNRVQIPFSLVTHEYLNGYCPLYNLLQGLFFATIFIMSLYNLILYFITHFKPYLYYVGYGFSLLLYQGAYFGYLHMLTPLSSTSIYTILIISSIGFIVWLIYFIRELFDLDSKIPMVKKIFKVIIILLTIAMVGLLLAHLSYNHYYAELFFNIINSIMPIYIGVILFSLYYLFYKEREYLTLWYALGWSFVSFSGFLMILTYMGWVDMDYRINYIFEATMLFETLLLSILLAYRLRVVESEKKEKDKLLLHQSKLASMGEMIGMIAHQWRQPLAEINGLILGLDIDYRKKRVDANRLNYYLDELEGITMYLSNTIDDFMNFFDKNKEMQSFTILELFDEISKILSTRLEDVEFLLGGEADLELNGYRSELLQVLLIVVNNAIDATRLADVVSPMIVLKVTKKDNKYVSITIENNGGRIEEDILSRVFDPYFTTKGHTQGNGLGLYILKMIIEKSMFGSVDIRNTDNGIVVEIRILRVQEYPHSKESMD